MELISYACKNFAGLNNIKIDFRQGMNVLYGKNEAGKSSIIEGIYASLFRSSKLDKRKDLDFIHAYFPKDGSDTIDSSLEFKIEGRTYLLEKVWGKGQYSRLSFDDGTSISNPDKIEAVLSDLLLLGPASYRYLIFSSQKNLRDSYYYINADEEYRSDVSNFIKANVMEMDGMSTEKFERDLEEKISDLAKRWDIDNERPENNRGINNKYKVGLGRVLEAYYRVEELKAEIRDLFELEKTFEEKSEKLSKLKSKILTLDKEYKSLLQISEDVRQRSNLEFKIIALEKDGKGLYEISYNWPILEKDLVSLEKDLEALKKDLEKLRRDQEAAKLEKERLKIQENVDKLIKLSKELGEKNKKLEDYNLFSQDLLLKLERLEREILLTQSRLETDDLSYELKARPGFDFKLFDAKGKQIDHVLGQKTGPGIRLQVGEDLDFTVKLKNLDIESLKGELTKLEEERKEIFGKTACQNLDQVREKHRERQDLDNRIKLENLEYQSLLMGKDLETWLKDLQNLEDKAKGLEIIDGNRDFDKEAFDLLDKKSGLEAEIKNKREKIAAYKGEFGDHKTVFTKFASLEQEIEKTREELSKLKALPESFASPDEFFKHLEDLRRSLEVLKEEERLLDRDHSQLELSLPEYSCEDLKRDLRDYEGEFIKLKDDLKAYLKIRDIYLKTKEDFKNDPMKGLEESMKYYLARLVVDGTRLNSITGDMSFDLSSRNKEIKYMHLSEGSKDSLALALRLALIDRLYGDKNIFMVFDDDLTDMDMDREAMAVELIKERAKDKQVIFASCNQNLAEKLGGNIIEIRS